MFCPMNKTYTPGVLCTLYMTEPADGKQDGACELNVFALDPVAEQCVEQVDGGGGRAGPGTQGEEKPAL